MTCRVFLREPGVICALGSGLEEVSNAIFEERASGLRKKVKLFSSRETVVGEIRGSLPEIPSHLQDLKCRNNQILLAACEQIIDKIEMAVSHYGASRIGIVLGTSTSGIEQGERFFKNPNSADSRGFRYFQQEIGNPSEFLRRLLGIRGPCFTISTACSSSGKAFASAKRLIDHGICDAVLVGGSDSLCELTLNGFDSLDSVSGDRCNPMSENRSGINIGEGAALFLMSRIPSDVELLSVGESTDGYHISAPDPQGKGAILAMKEALDQANISPEDVGYINLHGTATIKNDEMEAKSVFSLFGDRVPCSSTKPMMGHTLGAAGALEVAVCYLCLSSQWNPGATLPPHIWDGVYDGRLDPIKIVSSFDRLKSNICMSNNYAFGGNNVSVLLRGV